MYNEKENKVRSIVADENRAWHAKKELGTKCDVKASASRKKRSTKCRESTLTARKEKVMNSYTSDGYSLNKQRNYRTEFMYRPKIKSSHSGWSSLEGTAWFESVDFILSTHKKKVGCCYCCCCCSSCASAFFYVLFVWIRVKRRRGCWIFDAEHALLFIFAVRTHTFMIDCFVASVHLHW